MPARYEGFISITPIAVDVVLWPGNDGCECFHFAPLFGDCLPTDDVGECDPSCVECGTAITLRAEGEDDRTYAPVRGIAVFHRAASGSSITLSVSGCLGDVEATIVVPEPEPNLVQPPEQLPGDRTRVQWSPTGTDEAYIEIGAAGRGMMCRVPDTGLYDLGLPFRYAESVGVDRRTQVGPLVQDNAYLDLFQAQSGFWQKEGTFAVRPAPHPALFE